MLSLRVRASRPVADGAEQNVEQQRNDVSDNHGDDELRQCESLQH